MPRQAVLIYEERLTDEILDREDATPHLLTRIVMIDDRGWALSCSDEDQMSAAA